MSDEMLQRIDALAAKLGVVGEHLWEVLVRQSYVEAVTSFVFLPIVLTVAWLFVRWVRGWKKDPYGDYEVHNVAAGIVVGVTLGVILSFSVCLAIDGVGKLVNPEYYALQKLLP